MTDDFDVNNDGGVVIHQQKFITKDKRDERMQEKRCKRCHERLSIHEEESGAFSLWCLQCNIADGKIY